SEYGGGVSPRIDDPLRSAAADGDVDAHACVIGGELLVVFQPLPQLLWQQLEVSHGAHAEASFRLPKLVGDIPNDFDQQLEFLRFTLEVLGAEQVHGHRGDAHLVAPVTHLGDLTSAHAVPMGDVGEAVLPRPASVAVGHDGDV